MTTTNELINSVEQLATETWENGEGLGGKVSETFTNIAQRLRELEKDAARFDWIIENCTTKGGGHGFTLSVFVPVDSEDIGTAIDVVIAGEAT